MAGPGIRLHYVPDVEGFWRNGTVVAAGPPTGAGFSRSSIRHIARSRAGSDDKAHRGVTRFTARRRIRMQSPSVSEHGRG